MIKSNYSRYTYLVHWASVILNEAKNLSSTEQSYNEILRFAQNDKVNSYDQDIQTRIPPYTQTVSRQYIFLSSEVDAKL
jgi:hypothetical protein